MRVVCVCECVRHGRVRREHEDTILADSFTATIPYLCEGGGGEEGSYFLAISEALSARMSQGLDTARSSSNVLILFLPKQF